MARFFGQPAQTLIVQHFTSSGDDLEPSDFIAILALVTSVISITYTVIVDKRRPKLKVSGDIRIVIVPGVGQQGSFFAIHATNHGPGRVNVLGVGLTHRSRLKRWYRRTIKRDETQAGLFETSPESPNQLPMWLEVGDRLTLFYPEDSNVLEESEIFDCLYLYDSLGGKHWAQKDVFKSARKTVEQRD